MNALKYISFSCSSYNASIAGSAKHCFNKSNFASHEVKVGVVQATLRSRFFRQQRYWLINPVGKNVDVKKIYSVHAPQAELVWFSGKSY